MLTSSSTPLISGSVASAGALRRSWSRWVARPAAVLVSALALGGALSLPAAAQPQSDEASLARGAVPDTTPQQRYQSAIREAGGGLKVSLEECRAITLTQPGARYLRISSGLGDAEPAELLIHPIEHRGRLFGLLELASLQPLGGAAGLLIQEIVPVFAMCLDILQRAERSETLLEQTRMAEAMRQTATQPGGGVA